MQHEVASINLDEDVWDEVRNFKKCLIKMWASEGREVLFLETAVQLQRQKRHCVIEAVPVPAGVASRQAPLYFKKVSSFVELLFIQTCLRDAHLQIWPSSLLEVTELSSSKVIVLASERQQGFFRQQSAVRTEAALE